MADLVVSNHPIPQANGTYIDQGGVGDSRTWTKAIPEWTSVTEFEVSFDSIDNQWELYGSSEDDSESAGVIGYGFFSQEGGPFDSSTLPWESEVILWAIGVEQDVFNVDLASEEQPSEPTFGLPAESVALIESRFGTVANYLRLRNQGQI